MGQGTQYKIRYIEFIEEKVKAKNSLELIDTLKCFLNIISVTQQRSTINECDLMKLIGFYTAKNNCSDKAARYRIGKDLYQLYIR